jgi:hypothetical protein
MQKSGVAGGLFLFLMTSARATSIQPARALAGYLRILLSTFISELELFNGILVIPVEHRVVSEHPRNDPTSNYSGSSDAALVEGTSTDSGVTGARLAETRLQLTLSDSGYSDATLDVSTSTLSSSVLSRHASHMSALCTSALSRRDQLTAP